MHQGVGMESNKGLPGERSLVLHTDFHNKQTIRTLIDSGTSDHCFADKSFFISYSPLNQNISGLSTSINSTFNILGRGTVKFKMRVEGTLRSITLNNAMYIPDLRSNLISVSRLLEKGVDAIFSVTDNSVSIKMLSGPIIFSATKKGNLFYVDVEQDECTAYLSQSMQKPVDFATWHRHLAHTGTDTLQNIIRNKLVNGMNTYGEMALGGMCEDCIFGKHTSHPYNGTMVKERDILECIYIDLWGPVLRC